MSHSRLIQEPYHPFLVLNWTTNTNASKDFSKIRDLEKRYTQNKTVDGPGIDLKEDALHMERFKLCQAKGVDAIKKRAGDRIQRLRKQRRLIYFKSAAKINLPWDLMEYILELSASKMTWATIPPLQRQRLPLLPIVGILGNIKGLFEKILKEMPDSCEHGINRLWKKSSAGARRVFTCGSSLKIVFFADEHSIEIVTPYTDEICRLLNTEFAFWPMAKDRFRILPDRRIVYDYAMQRKGYVRLFNKKFHFECFLFKFLLYVVIVA